MELKERIKNEFMVIKALGVVYGDIGTSPIYTLAVIFALIAPTRENIFSVLSFIFWTLTFLVTIQYGWLATSLSKRGEGGTVVLVQLLLPYLKSAKAVSIISIMGYVGISLMIGDGVITPAISILSAVEGVVLIPGYEHTPKLVLLFIASIIAFTLFYIQKKGVEHIASAFGPIMVVWFLILGLVGLWNILQESFILKAINPFYALHFLLNHPVVSFIMLADVILAATGGEALYADMGHLGRLPILKGWLFAFGSLVLSYFGQGAFIISHTQAVSSPLFEMTKNFLPAIYTSFLILTIIATIIASQAMISGIFAVLYQAMTTRIFPHFKVDYTSHELRTQIYVNSVNWFLFFCVILMLFIFEESSKLAAAYGLAVTGAMSITGVLMSLIFWFQKRWLQFCFSILSGVMSFMFFASCTLKIPHGGYWSLLIASVPLFIVILYTEGQQRLYNSLAPTDKESFLKEYMTRYLSGSKITGTALFFARHYDAIPAYIPKTMFENGIMYERNIITIIKTTTLPHGVNMEVTKIAEGLDLMVIHLGYMEILDIESMLNNEGINERAIFYGQDEIVPSNIFWSIFAMVKNLSPSFVHFYDFPSSKIIGVARRVEM